MGNKTIIEGLAGMRAMAGKPVGAGDWVTLRV